MRGTMTGMAAPGANNRSIVRPGGKLLCPNCEREGDILLDFAALERNPSYAKDLNPVYRCRKDRDGCGHVFSPGDPWIIQAYLSGDLVPREMLTAAMETLSELRATISSNDKPSDTERRTVSA
jgi:hypothetical protein